METKEIIRLLKETPEYKKGGIKKLIDMIMGCEVVSLSYIDKGDCVDLITGDMYFMEYVSDYISEEWYEIDEDIEEKIEEWWDSLSSNEIWDILKLGEIENWRWIGWENNDGGCVEFGDRYEYFGLSREKISEMIVGEYKIHMRDKKIKSLGL